MKRTKTYTAAMATASVALLAGVSAANAQMPVVCSSTQISPAKNDCVMPTATAPGGGNFPGSFMVPGTTTSVAIHGYIQFDIIRDMGPHFGDTATFAPVLEGVGVTNSGASAHALNGGTDMGVKATRPNVETRTPTAYGELKTYIEFDFNQTAGTQLAGNNDILRLRQAYGTLGPWLMGQTYSLFADPLAFADTAAGGQDVGMMNTANARKPGIRYTWLAGNGITIAGSAEQESFAANTAGTIAANATAASAAAASTAIALNETTVFTNLPRFIAAAQWDQPWGHLKLAAGGGATDVRQNNILAGGTSATPNHQVGDWALALSGHLNTWGKDTLRGGFEYFNGAMDLQSWVGQGSFVENVTAGTVKLTKAWAGYANYEHFFTNKWRANESFGYTRASGNPFSVACTGGTACPQAALTKVFFTNNLNVIYAPVPQADFILEWQHAYRQMMSGASGTANQIDAQFKFYF